MNETSDVDIDFKRLYSKTNNPPAVTVEEFLDALSFSSCDRLCRMIFLLQFQMAQPAHYPSPMGSFFIPLRRSCVKSSLLRSFCTQLRHFVTL